MAVPAVTVGISVMSTRVDIVVAADTQVAVLVGGGCVVLGAATSYIRPLGSTLDGAPSLRGWILL